MSDLFGIASVSGYDCGFGSISGQFVPALPRAAHAYPPLRGNMLQCRVRLSDPERADQKGRQQRTRHHDPQDPT